MKKKCEARNLAFLLDGESYSAEPFPASLSAFSSWVRDFIRLVLKTIWTDPKTSKAREAAPVMRQAMNSMLWGAKRF